MSEHLGHIFIYSLLVFLNVFVLLKGKLRVSKFGVLVLVTLFLFSFHVGAERVLAFHHQQQDSAHSCCLPQNVDMPVMVNFDLGNKTASDKADRNVVFVLEFREKILNNKSPPLF